jgi:type IV pilus assembly protein PilM
MFGMFEKDLCPIGIDVGNHSVRLLQFRRRKEQLALQWAAHVEMDSISAEQTQTQRVAAAIRQALSSGKFSGKRAVLSLPPLAIHSKSVRLPQMPDGDLAQALQWEAKDRFGFEIEDGRIVWFRAGEIRRGTEVKDELLLFAIQGQALIAHLDATASAGLGVEAIDLAACALYRGAHRTMTPPSQSAEVTAILDVGYAGSQFIITRENELVFYKHIEMGARTINEVVAQKLGISVIEAAQMRSRLATEAASPAPSSSQEDSAPLGQALQDAMRPTLEDMARELDMCMRYFVITFRGSRPDLLSLTGRESKCPWLGASLAASLGLKVATAQPLRGVLDLRDLARPDRSGEWALAAGLSLYPLSVKRLEAAA